MKIDAKRCTGVAQICANRIGGDMKDNKINFTKKAISALPTPKSGIAIYHDSNKRSLKLRVRSTGTKIFFLNRRVNGKAERITIGSFPEITVEQARKKADILNAQIAGGVNPNAEKRAIRDELTFGELFNQFVERHAKPHKKTWEEDVRQFNRYLIKWAPKTLSNIGKMQVQKLHLNIRDNNGIYAANRILALLSAVFNKAIEWGWGHPNPTYGIKKFKEKSRERFIQGDELSRLFKALTEELNTTVRDYILISLLTGARRSNVLKMRWNEINFNISTWTIPETKIGESQTIPLIPEAIKILQQRYNNLPRCDWAFPGSGKTGHLVEPKKAWQRILQNAKIENLRLHDLRRSMGSWQAATGANLSIIGKTLGHKNVSTTAIYARLNLDPVRESMDKAAKAMYKAAHENSTNN